MLRETSNSAHEHIAGTVECYTDHWSANIFNFIREIAGNLRYFFHKNAAQKHPSNQAKIQAMNACCQVFLASRPGCWNITDTKFKV